MAVNNYDTPNLASLSFHGCHGYEGEESWEIKLREETPVGEMDNYILSTRDFQLVLNLHISCVLLLLITDHLLRHYEKYYKMKVLYMYA